VINGDPSGGNRGRDLACGNFGESLRTRRLMAFAVGDAAELFGGLRVFLAAG
jgi:hypothetical protein